MITQFLFSDDRRPRAGEATLVVRIPAGLNRKRRLLAEFARQLRLPGYFGWNWDAFEESLRDLTWLDGVSDVVIVHHDIPFAKSPEQQAIYLSILHDRLGETMPGSLPVQVVFPLSARAQLPSGNE